MVAISSQQPAIVAQNSNTVPLNELRAVPQQEKTVNNQDNSVSATQATPLASNQQAPQPEQAAQVISQTEQQLQRAAVEASATTPLPQVTAPENREVNQQPNVETRQTENRQQVAEDNTVEASAPPVEPQSSPSTTNSSAVSTYQQVGNLGSDQPRQAETDNSRVSSSPASSPTQPSTSTTSTSSASSEAQETTPERQVFGGAIDAPRQQAG